MGLLYSVRHFIWKSGFHKSIGISLRWFHCDDCIVIFELGRGASEMPSEGTHKEPWITHSQLNKSIQLIDSISIVTNTGAKINKNLDKHKYYRSDTDSRLRTPKHLGRVEGTQEHKALAPHCNQWHETWESPSQVLSTPILQLKKKSSTIPILYLSWETLDIPIVVSEHWVL